MPKPKPFAFTFNSTRRGQPVEPGRGHLLLPRGPGLNEPCLLFQGAFCWSIGVLRKTAAERTGLYLDLGADWVLPASELTRIIAEFERWCCEVAREVAQADVQPGQAAAMAELSMRLVAAAMEGADADADTGEVLLLAEEDADLEQETEDVAADEDADVEVTFEQVVADHPDLACPEGLDPLAVQAHREMVTVFGRRQATFTDGQAFYSPAGWGARWPRRAGDIEPTALLVISYCDGSELGRFFDYDDAADGSYREMELMRDTLKRLGLYTEAHSRYSVLYRV